MNDEFTICAEHYYRPCADGGLCWNCKQPVLIIGFELCIRLFLTNGDTYEYAAEPQAKICAECHDLTEQE
jgi:hypothetical protein